MTMNILGRGVSRFSGQTPVRFDGAPGSPWTGESKWRGVRDFEHGTLVRTFGLPDCCCFDLPSSVRGTGSNSSGSRGSRIVNGFVMHPAFDKPIGKLTIVREADKFKDVDPTNERDFFDLSHH
jgi:hypothetical protein